MHYPQTLRRWISVATLAMPLAAAAAYPDKSIEWVVPYPAGGGSDVVARILSLPMSQTLGQPIIINNKPGAATNIGADYAAKAKPDGYVMLTGDTATMAANPALYSRLSYNVEKDFTPVGLMARFPLILVVNPSVPAKNLTEFMAWAKQQPTGVNYATPGAGSPHHLATELFRERSGLKMVHVGYRGAAPAVQDVIGGQVPMMFVDTASGYQHIQSGRLVAIGVASPKRIATFNTLPTLAEQGLKGFEAYAWQGLVVPAATPPEAVATLSKALLAALDSTEVKARFQTLGLEAIPSTPAQMAAYAKAEREKWAKVIRASNIRLD
ncbi:putative exported protein [Polaromonas sp. CG9_12]|nr:putative exported protein [Polaromonas sp. CG9_12]